MAFLITPLTAHTGAEIRGLDLREPLDADNRAALNHAFSQHHVLVVRDQKYQPEDFLRAVQLWGDLQPHDKKDQHIPGFPDIAYVTNEEFLGDKRIIPGETFHTDHSNHPAPPKATILYPVSLPSRGGDTQYVNMHLAYDDLPEAVKRRIDGLKAVHVYLSKYSPRALKPLNEESRQALPPPGIHPLVRVHPENRRKALFLNPVRIEGIVGMPDDEALQLVAELMAHAIQPKYEYRHQWRHGDMVLWDNRSVMHKANPDYDMKERRLLWRLMLQGEAPIPVSEAA
ncbi:MAG TPA: TauD/TfdA family dioxygenase [Stellaceae bacterium]|nr:TauD/TfdA family dioxygenase [Stellaceae bacterium]